MRVIHKHKIDLDTDRGEFPEGEVVTVAFQHGWPHVWINQEENTTHRMNLEWVVTGDPFDDMGMSHVGSCVSDTFVLHVYRGY